MQQNTPLSKQVLKIAILNKRNHENKKSNRNKQQTGERIGGFDEELIMRRGAEKLRRGLNAMAECVDLFHVEHHESAARDGDDRVENAYDEERR